ncbi:MAG: hypothetical protein HUU29_13240 [Planctomycetaceae bacterium]|nr:hypothetical protein [Planctomycetaceae bacterium]
MKTVPLLMLAMFVFPAALMAETHVMQSVDLVLPLSLTGIGIFLLVIELMVLPGFGLAGILGIVLLGGGLFLISRDLAAQAFELSTTDLSAIMAGIVGATAGCTAVCLSIFKLLPVIPGVRKMIHKEALGQHNSQTETLQEHLVGQSGVASTDLRPAGKVRIDGRVYDVTTTDGYISSGAQVYVEKIHEGHVVVRKLA